MNDKYSMACKEFAPDHLYENLKELRICHDGTDRGTGNREREARVCGKERLMGVKVL